jgi:hypothetical protein
MDGGGTRRGGALACARLGRSQLHGVAEAACRHPGFAWVEQSAVIVGAGEDQVTALAREFGQPAVLRWTPGLLTAIDTATGAPLSPGEPVAVTRLPRRPCVMKGEVRDEVCRNPGGPWISRAMQYARDWTDRRTSLFAALDCDTCLGAKAEGPMGKHADSGRLQDRKAVPSRYGVGRRPDAPPRASRTP